MNKGTKKRIRAGVIGVGYLGQHHARIYSELEDAELVGVADTNIERAGEIARKYGTKAYKDYKDLIGNADALSIVVPTTLHYEIAVECLTSGKDIIVEKPVTTTIAEADELIGEAERQERILQVGHLERYNSGIMALSEMIDRPIFFESLRLSPFLNRATDVDVTLDLMIHDIDIVLSLVSSPVRSVKAIGFSSITDMIDEARAWVEFENGLAGFFTASRISEEKQRKLKVFQDNSYIELDYQNGSIKRFSHRGAQEDIKPEFREPLKEELKDFIRCVMNRETPRVSGIEGRDALRVVLEINSLVR
ncbi:MAG: Gfo/Idh/MocA family oxidoreductase [Nitrospirota bacterium]